MVWWCAAGAVAAGAGDGATRACIGNVGATRACIGNERAGARAPIAGAAGAADAALRLASKNATQSDPPPADADIITPRDEQIEFVNNCEHLTRLTCVAHNM